MQIRSWVVLLSFLLAACAAGTHGGDLPTSSDQTNAQKRAVINTELAAGYYQRGEKEVALDKIKLALAADPEFADAYSVRGLIYMDMGEARLADENFQHALRLAPNNGDFNNNYGWFLCQNGRAKEAIPYFDTAVKNRNYQTPALALDDAGMCSLKFNDTAAAEQYFTRAFQYDPSNFRINVNLAKLYYEKHDYERANFYVGRVVKADNADADVLWLGIKVAHKLGDRLSEAKLGTELHQRLPNSTEYAAYSRGAFDE